MSKVFTRFSSKTYFTGGICPKKLQQDCKRRNVSSGQRQQGSNSTWENDFTKVAEVTGFLCRRYTLIFCGWKTLKLDLDLLQSKPMTECMTSVLVVVYVTCRLEGILMGKKMKVWSKSHNSRCSKKIKKKKALTANSYSHLASVQNKKFDIISFRPSGTAYFFILRQNQAVSPV